MEAITRTFAIIASEIVIIAFIIATIVTMAAEILKDYSHWRDHHCFSMYDALSRKGGYIFWITLCLSVQITSLIYIIKL